MTHRRACARLARESGLLFPPDPGAAEQSQIGGNIATNAGGPHAFKYGVTGALGDRARGGRARPASSSRVGGPLRKDVAGYDLKSLLIGSEGTLGIDHRRLAAAPARRRRRRSRWSPSTPGRAAGCAAIERVLGSGLAVGRARVPRRRRRWRGRARSFPAACLRAPASSSWRRRTARRPRQRGCGRGARACSPRTPLGLSAPESARRGRGAVALARRRLVRGHRAARRQGQRGRRRPARPARRGDRGDARDRRATRPRTPAAGATPATGTSTRRFLRRRASDEASSRAREQAAEELFALAVALGGSISGEHGIGCVKRGQLARQWSPRALELHAQVKRAFDPKGLMNPGKKLG